MSATPSQCRQRAPTPVPGECPSPASDCSSEGLCSPRAWGIPSEGGEHHGMPRMPPCPGDALFFVAVGGTKRKMPPRVWGLPVPAPASGERPHAPGLASRRELHEELGAETPARARAGRASALSRPDARGNARTRQGWPVLAGDEDAQAGERPHAPGLVPGPASPRLSATPGGTRTRTLIYRTRTAHKGAIPPLCAAPCSLIPFLVCDTEKERGQDPRGTRRTGHSCCTA